MGNEGSKSNKDYSITIEGDHQKSFSGTLVLEVVRPLDLLFYDPTLPDGQEIVTLDMRMTCNGMTYLPQ